MAKIVIQLEGGLVQGAYLLKNNLFSNPNIDGVIVVDFDVEGADDNELTTTHDKSGALLESISHEEDITKMPANCDVRWAALAFLEPIKVANTPKEKLPLIMESLETDEGRKALEEKLK